MNKRMLKFLEERSKKRIKDVEQALKEMKEERKNLYKGLETLDEMYDKGAIIMEEYQSNIALADEINRLSRSLFPNMAPIQVRKPAVLRQGT